jgi:hypothetical protein
MSGGFNNDTLGGALGTLIRDQVQSANFNLAAQTGWAILKNGNAYFWNLTATGDITTTTVIVAGATGGTFIYDGAAGPGTLVVAITGAAGTDEFGNAYSGPGISVSAPGSTGKNEIQIRPDKDAVFIYAKS